jgi:hypothetical protein
MKKLQDDTLKMFETTSKVLHKDNSAWNTNIPFVAAVQELDDNINDIRDLSSTQNSDNRGIKHDKDNRRDSLQNQTFAAAGILTFYASTINNRKLLEKVSLTRTDLERARDNALAGIAEQVYQEAAANSTPALPYGLTATMITDLRSAIDEFVKYISKPRDARVGKKEATEQLVKVFADTNILLLERLDKGMELYVKTNNTFYTKYFKGRIIVNSPTIKRALEIRFEDAEDKTAITGVTVTVDKKIKRRSSAKGNSRVQNLVGEKHSLKAAHPGFLPASENFTIISGETTRLVIKMKKL